MASLTRRRRISVALRAPLQRQCRLQPAVGVAGGDINAIAQVTGRPPGGPVPQQPGQPVLVRAYFLGTDHEVDCTSRLKHAAPACFFY